MRLPSPPPPRALQTLGGRYEHVAKDELLPGQPLTGTHNPNAARLHTTSLIRPG
jgi:hypothetical protein